MKIDVMYPGHVMWRIDVRGLTHGMDLFRSTALNHLKKAFALLENSQFRFVFEKVDKPYLDRFAPMHSALMKERGDNFSVDFDDKILHHPIHDFGHEALSFYEGDTYLGGMIYSVMNKCVGMAYRVMPHKISLYLPAPLARMADVILATKAIELKKEHYSLGKDRNPFGPNGAIGLAGYKLMTRAKPYIFSEEPILSGFDWDESQDVLIFYGNPKTFARQAKLLLVDPSNIEKYHFLKQAELDLDIIHKPVV